METNEIVNTYGGDQTAGEHDRPLVRRLALDDITIDETVQARAQMLGEDVVEEYTAAMREGDEFPPLVVFQQGGTYVVADGFTRHAAAKRAGLTAFECVVHAGGLRDATLYAIGANASHGRPRSAADKRSAVLKLLADDAWCRWSSHRIAQLCRVSHQLVLELRSIDWSRDQSGDVQGQIWRRHAEHREESERRSKDGGLAGAIVSDADRCQQRWDGVYTAPCGKCRDCAGRSLSDR